jgi:hypothetical protein
MKLISRGFGLVLVLFPGRRTGVGRSSRSSTIRDGLAVTASTTRLASPTTKQKQSPASEG